VSDEDPARCYAARLLAELGVALPIQGCADAPALAWRRAGLMEVTGRPAESRLVCPAALASAADGALLALRALAPEGCRLPSNGAQLLGERARLMVLGPGGRVSANGSCRLIDTADTPIALNLARAEDWDLLPALFGCDAVTGWADVTRKAVNFASDDLLDRGIELSLPVARDERIGRTCVFDRIGSEGPPGIGSPVVIDLASLWAGPLSASLLGMMGAEVIKVEGTTRLDGARCGNRDFYDLLNGGKKTITVDFADRGDLDRLSKLLDRADIVIEGSRPRALRRLGIDRDRLVARGCVWVSITAHEDPDRVGFGDDAAIAAGLANIMARGWGEPLFAGDAIADPLTGLHAALGAWAFWRRGGGWLVSLSLSGTTACAIGAGVAQGAELQRWQALALNDAEALYPIRDAAARARPPGADNELLAGSIASINPHRRASAA
jgi:CoA-transferase family III